MYRQKHCHSRSAHNASETSRLTTPQSTRRGPYSRPHVASSRSRPYPQAGAPSAASQELHAIAGPSGSRRSARGDKGLHLASPSSRHGTGYHGSSATLRPSSSRGTSRVEFGVDHQITHSPPSAHRPRWNNTDPPVDYAHISDRPHGESSSSRHQPCLGHQPGTTTENREIFERIDYIRAWQGTLQPPNPPNFSSTKGTVSTAQPALATGPPKLRQ
jgi:hypothetical protein